MDDKQLEVELGERSYPIWIGGGLLPRITSFLEQVGVSHHQKILIITDEHVQPLYVQPLVDPLTEHGYTVSVYTLPAGESSKSFVQYEQVMTYAIRQKLDRKSVIMAVGGGVVGDLAGFVASTFMRGVAFIQVPTTIQAHDSSVGGKVAINHALGKNLVGSFYQPLAVIYDTDTLQSLPEREIKSGLAEVIKYALIWDRPFVEWLEAHREPLLKLQEPYLSEALYRACDVKRQVVSKDEKEQHLRAILNLGHTFGHAFEALGEYTTLTHGEAISIGMVMAARHSERHYARTDLRQRVYDILHAYGLPVEGAHLPWNAEQVLTKMYADKKVVDGSLTLILLREIGRAEVVQQVPAEEVKETLREEGISS